MTLNPQLHVDPTTIRDPSLAPYIAASTVGKVTGSEFDEADEVLSTDTTEALREAAKKRADTYDEEDPQSNKTPVAPVPQQLSDPKNVLKLELYRSLAGDGPSVEPRIMGMVEVHLHEIIQAMMVIDVLPLSLNGKHVADLYLEFAFMYGALGFHYSTQVRLDRYEVDDGLCVGIWS
ncbi:hypothetical protein FJT64_021209 [Amphibalanus amphitrite]|uniref:Uncharacterized protein n=1 Tax=Amphibalanus amphitrite TaxID=1232801 RepID=A0A6A4WJ93_AMPAM|nr:hypothetical protein FJT64_021209 [Amphibalanus amphitrite]